MANALSRQPELLPAHFLAISQVPFDLLELLRHENKTSPFYQNLCSALAANNSQFVDYDVRDGLLLHKGRLLLDPTSSLISLVLRECHPTPMAGHGGIQKTIAHVCAAFSWNGLKKDVQKFVRECANAKK